MDLWNGRGEGSISDSLRCSYGVRRFKLRTKIT